MDSDLDELALSHPRPGRPVRKAPLAESSANFQPSPSKSFASPSKSFVLDTGASPWKLKVTVEAQQDGDEESENTSPDRNGLPRATTFTVPLRDADAPGPARRRGRPRKSEPTVQTTTVPLNDADDTPPGKRRGRPRKSDTAAETTTVALNEAEESTPVKRGKGHPRKSDTGGTSKPKRKATPTRRRRRTTRFSERPGDSEDEDELQEDSPFRPGATPKRRATAGPSTAPVAATIPVTHEEDSQTPKPRATDFAAPTPLPRNHPILTPHPATPDQHILSANESTSTPQAAGDEDVGDTAESPDKSVSERGKEQIDEDEEEHDSDVSMWQNMAGPIRLSSEDTRMTGIRDEGVFEDEEEDTVAGAVGDETMMAGEGFSMVSIDSLPSMQHQSSPSAFRHSTHPEPQNVSLLRNEVRNEDTSEIMEMPSIVSLPSVTTPSSIHGPPHTSPQSLGKSLVRSSPPTRNLAPAAPASHTSPQSSGKAAFRSSPPVRTFAPPPTSTPTNVENRPGYGKTALRLSPPVRKFVPTTSTLDDLESRRDSWRSLTQSSPPIQQVGSTASTSQHVEDRADSGSGSWQPSTPPSTDEAQSSNEQDEVVDDLDILEPSRSRTPKTWQRKSATKVHFGDETEEDEEHLPEELLQANTSAEAEQDVTAGENSLPSPEPEADVEDLVSNDAEDSPAVTPESSDGSQGNEDDDDDTGYFWQHALPAVYKSSSTTSSKGKGLDLSSLARNYQAPIDSSMLMSPPQTSPAARRLNNATTGTYSPAKGSRLREIVEEAALDQLQENEGEEANVTISRKEIRRDADASALLSPPQSQDIAKQWKGRISQTSSARSSPSRQLLSEASKADQDVQLNTEPEVDRSHTDVSLASDICQVRSEIANHEYIAKVFRPDQEIPENSDIEDNVSRTDMSVASDVRQLRNEIAHHDYLSLAHQNESTYDFNLDSSRVGFEEDHSTRFGQKTPKVHHVSLGGTEDESTDVHEETMTQLESPTHDIGGQSSFLDQDSTDDIPSFEVRSYTSKIPVKLPDSSIVSSTSLQNPLAPRRTYPRLFDDPFASTEPPALSEPSTAGPGLFSRLVSYLWTPAPSSAILDSTPSPPAVSTADEEVTEFTLREDLKHPTHPLLASLPLLPKIEPWTRTHYKTLDSLYQTYKRSPNLFSPSHPENLHHLPPLSEELQAYIDAEFWAWGYSVVITKPLVVLSAMFMELLVLEDTREFAQVEGKRIDVGNCCPGKDGETFGVFKIVERVFSVVAGEMLREDEKHGIAIDRTKPRGMKWREQRV